MLNQLKRSLSLLALASTAAIAVAAAANAGECPADKRGINLTKVVTHAAKGVTDNVIASIDLVKETTVPAPDRKFRMRRLTVEPGGIVPWHSHGDRPAIIYVVQGEIIEFASTCAVGIVHKAGEATPELRDTSHWWQNTSSQPVVLLSADIMHDANDHNM